MSRLLKYALVLALAVAIGAFVVLGPAGLEDLVPSSAPQEAASVPAEPAAPAAPVSPASIDEELDYMVAKRLASLEGWRAFLAAHPNGAYAQSAQAEVGRRLGAENPSADAPAAAAGSALTDNERGGGIAQRFGSLASYAHSATAKVERLLLPEKAPPSGNAELSAGAPTDAIAASEPAAPVSPPSRGAVPAPAGAAVANDASLDAKPVREPTGPAAPAARTDHAAGTQVAALAPDEVCQRDEDRLARLRSNPSSDEAQRFATELGCEKLRTQVLALMESPAPAPSPQQPANSSPSNSLLTEGCVSERAALDRLRTEPSAEAAGLFWRDLKCEGLRPQVRLLLESLDVAPEPVGSTAVRGEAGGHEGAMSDAPTANGADPVACRSEAAELNRIRATPDLSDAKRFASAVTCDALKPQAARLLESLRE